MRYALPIFIILISCVETKKEEETLSLYEISTRFCENSEVYIPKIKEYIKEAHNCFKSKDDNIECKRKYIYKSNGNKSSRKHCSVLGSKLKITQCYKSYDSGKFKEFESTIFENKLGKLLNEEKNPLDLDLFTCTIGSGRYEVDNVEYKVVQKKKVVDGESVIFSKGNAPIYFRFLSEKKPYNVSDDFIGVGITLFFFNSHEDRAKDFNLRYISLNTLRDIKIEAKAYEELPRW